MTRPDPAAIVELRQYTLHPGKRDVLVELFEREFFETQEAVGMRLLGQFRDLDDPNRFVWLRGFPDMATRDSALRTFYGGPVWKAHRVAANATMVDSSDVLLLRPAPPAFGFRLDDGPPAVGAGGDGVVVAAIHHLDGAAGGGFPERFERALTQAVHASGMSLLATFETEPSQNTFPELPVREGERVFVWFAASGSGSEGEDAAAVASRLAHPAQVLRLAPTPRSRVRL